MHTNSLAGAATGCFSFVEASQGPLHADLHRDCAAGHGAGGVLEKLQEGDADRQAACV